MKNKLKIIVQDLRGNPIARLKTVKKPSYKKTSGIWSASFVLPMNDQKNKHLTAFNYVDITEGENYIGLYRIMPKETVWDESNETITYTCQHVKSTLMDDVVFGYKQIINRSTEDVIKYLLSFQDTKRWVLKRCDFKRFFHYSWENENGLLGPLESIPKVLDEPYMWEFNTRVFPWEISLIKPPTEPVCVLREGRNLRGFTITEDPRSLVNRIYPVGYGEGVNALNIRSINGGIPYVEDKKSIRNNGLVQSIWSDKRFKVKDNLKASAIAKLGELKEPIVTWKVSAADLTRLSNESEFARIVPHKMDEFRYGTIVRIVTKKYGNVDLRINSEHKPDCLEEPGDIQLEVGSVKETLASTQADLERKQQINDNYSQGAVNIIPYIFRDDVDPSHPAILNFYLDEDVVNVNTCDLYLDTTYYRAHSKGNQSTPTTVSSSTTEGGGATTQSSSSGGGSSQTSSAAGQSTSTSSSGGDHRHVMFRWMGESTSLPGMEFAFTTDNYNTVGFKYFGYKQDMQTASSSGDHTHNVTTPSHQHNVNIPDHTHSVTINAHTHKVTFTIPSHTHEIIYGIFEYDKLPSVITLNIDEKDVWLENTSVERFSLIDHLKKNDDGTITRGKHTLKITPNDLARVEVQLVLRVFIQSQLGGEF